MGKEAFIIHTDTWPAIKSLNREQRGDLFTALMCHQLGEEIPKMDVQTQMAFMFMSAQMDRDNQKYETITEKRRQAANARWQRNAEHNKHNMQMHNLHYDTVTDTDTDTVTDTDTERDTDTEARAPLPPLSLKDEGDLRQIVGDRADGLIADVRTYYEAHPEKTFPGWPIALAQFDRNQRRWGTAQKKQNNSFEKVFAAFEADMQKEAEG